MSSFSGIFNEIFQGYREYIKIIPSFEIWSWKTCVHARIYKRYFSNRCKYEFLMLNGSMMLRNIFRLNCRQSIRCGKKNLRALHGTRQLINE